MSKIAVKGVPDFTLISDERLGMFIDLAQTMIFSYKGLDAEKVKVFEEVWHDLTIEHSGRLAEQEIVVEPCLRKMPKLRRSPVKLRK